MTLSAKRRVPYSEIRHLAWSLWLNHDPARFLLAMISMPSLAAYFDASGDDKRPKTLAVAGLVSSQDKWERCEHEWGEMLTSFGVPYLHMNELNSYPYRKPYDVWPREDKGERRKEFLGAALAIAKKNINKIVVLNVDVADFDAVNDEYDLDGIYKGSPFCFTCTATVYWMRHWKGEQKQYSGWPLKYFYEDGDQGRGCVRTLSHQMARIEVVPKRAYDEETGRWFAPFQIADFVAYESGTEWDRRNVDVKVRATRGAMLEIEKQLSIEYSHYTRDNIRDLVKMFPESFPPRGAKNPSASATSEPSASPPPLSESR